MEICPSCHGEMPASQPPVCKNCGRNVSTSHWERINHDRFEQAQSRRDQAHFEPLEAQYRAWFDSVAAASIEARRDMLAAYVDHLGKPHQRGMDRWELYKFFPLNDPWAATWQTGGWEPAEAAKLLLKHWMQGLFSRAEEPQVLALWQKVCIEEARLLKPTPPSEKRFWKRLFRS